MLVQPPKFITTLQFIRNNIDFFIKIQALYILLLLFFVYIAYKMDITKFLRVSKKRDLNNQSDSEEQQKKAREGSSEDNLEVGSVFTTSMDSPECLQILFNCLQNVEKSVKEIHEMQEKTQSSQIKGELQLKDLSEAVEFITKKFDQYETERKEKEKIINDLQGKVSEMLNEIEVLKNSLDPQQQYSRRNCVLIHGIPEQKGEDKDEQALKK